MPGIPPMQGVEHRSVGAPRPAPARRWAPTDSRCSTAPCSPSPGSNASSTSRTANASAGRAFASGVPLLHERLGRGMESCASSHRGRRVCLTHTVGGRGRGQGRRRFGECCRIRSRLRVEALSTTIRLSFAGRNTAACLGFRTATDPSLAQNEMERRPAVALASGNANEN